VLVLFLMYLGVIALWRTVDDPSRAGRAAAILTLVGAINLPIIKFSVDWWNTLHQPASVLRVGGPAIHASILTPLLVMALAFALLFVTLHLAAMRNEILRRRVRAMWLLQAHAAQGA
jgi:heme exporter protein C